MPLKPIEFIPVEHICNFVANIVNEMDLSETNGKYRDTLGKPAYSRKVLLRQVSMASTEGVFSSQKIANPIR